MPNRTLVIKAVALLLSALAALSLSLLSHPIKAMAAAPTCEVPAGLVYNIPNGTPAQQFRWHRLLTCMIKATPKGAAITIATYSWSDEAAADALIDADTRGVAVRVVMWDLRQNGITGRFAKALNDGKTAGSFLKVCKGACLGPTAGPEAPAIHHAKVYNFSRVNMPGGKVASNVVQLGTGNPSLSNGDVSWNTWRSIPGNPKLYAGTTAYVMRMRNDRDQRTSKATPVASGATTAHLFPQKLTSPDRQVDLLRKVSCKGGKTDIRAAIFTWTFGRVQIAREMARLQKAGCDVRVIINYDSALLDAQVLSTLLGGKVPVYNAHRGEMHTHAKDLIVSSAALKVVQTGSGNWTKGSKISNDEVGFEVRSPTVVGQHLTLWDLWARNSSRITLAAASKTSSPDATDETPPVTVPTTNDPNLRPENQ